MLEMTRRLTTEAIRVKCIIYVNDFAFSLIVTAYD
jgi:hypothetical protein